MTGDQELPPTFSFYRSADGTFTGQTYQGPAEMLALQIEHLPGLAAIEGEFDHRTQCVDLSGDEPSVVDVVPPVDAAGALAAARAAALDEIDAAAGAARLRYITEAPGQQAVYLRKAEQARAFRVAGYAGEAPPYVAAEADATGLTAQQASDRILAIAEAWDNVLSPAIEGLRIKGKMQVAAAAAPDVVEAVRGATLAGLAEI